MRAVRIAIGLVLLLGIAAGARAEPVDLVLATCLRGEAAAIRRLVQVELGAPATPGEGVRAEVACDRGQLVVTVQDRARGVVTFRVDPSGTPATARARLIALAVAEAVAARHIELDPPSRIGPSPVTSPMHEVTGSGVQVREAREAGAGDLVSGTLQGVAAARTLGSEATTVGGGVAVMVPLGEHSAAGGDFLAEGGLSPVSAGNVHVFLASLSPRLVARGRYGALVVEAGAGVRMGLARLSGDSSAPSMIEGRTVHAPWGGPIAVSAVRVPFRSRAHVGLGVEAGYTTLSVVGRVPMSPPVALRGAWLGLHLSAGVDIP